MPDGTIRLHLGAHKTASSYIQATLELNRAQSAAAGLAYWPLHHVRPIFQRLLQKRGAPQIAGFALAPDGLVGSRQPAEAKRLDTLFVPGMDTTISEENILGNSEDCYRGGLYPKAAKRLSILQRFPADRPLHVFLAVRSYAPFLASLYAQSLRHGHFIEWRRFARANSSCSGQWPALIEAIRASRPDAQITIWKYEDFSSVGDEVLSALSGLPAENLAKPVQRKILPSASGRAVEEMMAAAPQLASNERVFKMLALDAQFPRSKHARGFSPWTEEQAARLDEQYDADLSLIRERDDDEVLG